MRLLHQLIVTQARKSPGAPAVAFEGQVLTYAELDDRAEALANHLQHRGVGPDTIVGLYLERSLETIVGLLAVLKAGGAYLPIDPALPQSRVEFMLADANATTLLTQSSLLPFVAGDDHAPILLDGFEWTDARPSTSPSTTPNDLAYVIYTSGSTGRPKGVAVEHRNIVSYVEAIVDRFGFEPGMSHATVSTIAADLGNTVIFPALASGGCVHVISQERSHNQSLLSEYFQRERIDVLKIVPSHLAALQAGSNPQSVMPRCRLILGGEPSRLEWIRRLQAFAPTCHIHNHYGPTEATVGALTYPVPRLSATASGPVPLGSALPNSRVRIVRETGQIAAAGEDGELWIGGSGVARGYLNRPQLTAQKFVEDPLATDSDGRFYRTGDLVRSLPDGTLEFRGRIDDQIKISGNRIEPGEVEVAVRECGGVQDAVVLARDDESGARHLVAYVVPRRSDQPLWEHSGVHILPDGSPVAHLNRNETDYIYHEIFELQSYRRHGITIRDGDCIVDAGANIGLFTVFVSRLAGGLRVLAFEPNPAAFECLQLNARAYGNDVTCIPAGLSRENGVADMTFFEGMSLLSGFYADAAVEREVVRTYVSNQQNSDSGAAPFGIDEILDERLRSRTVSAQLRTLSDVIQQERLSHIDLLKINVEKSELDVLQGLAGGDWLKIRQMVIEVDRAETLEPIAALLEGHGFEIAIEQDPLLQRTDLRYVYALRADGRRAQDTDSTAVRQQLHAAGESVVTPAALRARLKSRLPQYMVPSAFVLMHALPLTSNGKVDRQALPAPSSDQAGRRRSDSGVPCTPTERMLASIWSDLLQTSGVGRDDDFFDLGGQSLVAIKAVARIRETFNVDISLRHLFEHATLAGLAGVIDGLQWRSNSPRQTAGGAREELAL